MDTALEPYLTGVYTPVADERDDAGLAVTGELPPNLWGQFLRNGPNPMFAPKGRYHLFDGDGMLHGVTLGDGRASYRNRWIRNRGLDAEIAAGRSLYGGMANADFPDPEIVGDAGPMKNVANTHVVRHAGRILCLWEAGLPTQVDHNLETVGPWDFDGRLRGAMTAHPKIDPVTGEMLFFGYSAIPPYLRFHVADASGALVRTLDIDLPAPVMIHDFVTTAEHVVFLDAPAVFDFAGFAAGGPMLAWKPELGTRIGVMRRGGDGADIRWFDVETCYVFHFMNAWTDDSKVVIDASRLTRMDIGLESDGVITPDADGHLARFTVDLDAGRASWERIGQLPGDFPRIDDRRAGLVNRFGYTATFSSGHAGGGQFDAVTKYDLVAGTELTQGFPGRVSGEPVFAADPNGTVEDDGWILTFVGDDHSSALAVLDAHDLRVVAEVEMARRVPFGFHGSWLPA
ncbi:MAG: carotenoid oxygenase family protein [Acidimicrobiia bacterium]